MLLCEKCHQFTAQYSYEKHEYECTACGHVEQVEPQIARCPRCGREYTSYTWFDPSGCGWCNYSFVD